MNTGKIADSRVKIWNDEAIDEVFGEHYYGKKVEEGYLELSLVEAMHLVDREELEVEVDGEVPSREDLYHLFSGRDEDFDHKYAVYSDLRERGYIVKTGFKFGAHFRVYPRGVNPYKEGPKKSKEHTKWIVNAVPENYNQDYQEMSRAVRLAQNIRAAMVWAVVDSEREVTYYRVERLTP